MFCRIATEPDHLRKPGGQFHQHLMVNLRQFPCVKKNLTYTMSAKKHCAKLLYEKAGRKMLVKLTPNRVYLETFSIL